MGYVYRGNQREPRDTRGIDTAPTKTRELRPCGTRAAYVRHKRNGEEPCLACHTAYKEYKRELNSRRKRTRKLKPCGTYAAWMRHHRNGEKPCYKCRIAHSAYMELKRERKRAA